MQVGPLILYSALVGALTGALGAAFVWLLAKLQMVFLGDLLGYLPPGLPGEGGVGQIFRGPVFWPWLLLLPLIFVASSLLGNGRGLGYYLSAYRRRERIRVLDFGRAVLSTLVQLGSGSPMGRDGPLATMGLWLGGSLGRRFPLGNAGDYLPFAGMAAGFAAAFHAPVAGALLASEMVFRGLALEIGALAPALIGALAGFTVYGFFMGYGPLLEIPSGALNWNTLPFGLLLGLICAGIGTLLLEGEQWLRRILQGVPRWICHGVFGLILAGLLLIFPEALGNGLPWVQLSLSPILETRFLAALLGITFVLVLLAGAGRLYGSHLLPAMMMGGLAGLLLTKLIPFLAPAPEAAVVSGLCALLAGVARAPFAAIVLAGEIGDYSLLLLVIVTAFVSYTFTSSRGSLEAEEPEQEPEKVGNPLQDPSPSVALQPTTTKASDSG